MLVLHDENLTITGVQTFPKTTNAPHIEADDELFDQVSKIVGVGKLVDNNGTLELSNNLQELADQIQVDKLTTEARQKRDDLLIQLDKIVSNPLRYNELAQETKDELSTYRQDLLNVPQQDGFPTDIIWPTMPQV